MSNTDDINDIIASAVNARVEAAVAEALCNEDTMKQYVQAALRVPTGDFRDKKPLITHLVQQTIEQKTKAVLAEEIEKMDGVIRDEVRAGLSKSFGVIADGLVNGFIDATTGSYPSIKVEFRG